MCANLRSTDYLNTIAPDAEPAFPGDEHIERRIRAYIRWNAAVMVHRAQRPGIGVGGHISTYASAAALYEVGFNHFFRGHDAAGGGDQIYFQGHASPGIYARAFLEGRLTESQLDGFRQEFSHAGLGGGLPSYPHPRLMPDSGSSPRSRWVSARINAIYQARFNRYLHNRGLKDTSDQRVWAFLGDGEMDEPESLGAIGVAAREELDNLTFVVNCNLQRLDGPVRGNGKIIQELESYFCGAGWNVIKVIWGRDWDPLLAADTDGALVNLMNTTPGRRLPDLQGRIRCVRPGALLRPRSPHGRDGRAPVRRRDLGPQTRRTRLPQAVRRLPGGHRTHRAADGDPGQDHQGMDPRLALRGPQLHPSDEEADHGRPQGVPGPAVPGHSRLGARRGASRPTTDPRTTRQRWSICTSGGASSAGTCPRAEYRASLLSLPGAAAYDVARRGSGRQEVATTMAFVRLLKDLMKDPKMGHRFVPIIPDEARTFGLDSLFPSKKIYSPHGQNYLSVDREQMLSYQEDIHGVLLHEGITEAGSAASWTAAGTSYATHGEPMIPLYIFYSMFGFQRTGDQLWAAADQMTRGFLLGATAGRTTLNGEGLQHQDGHSLLLASTNPACVAYDAAYRLRARPHHRRRTPAHVRRSATRRRPNVFYYLTLYNEPIAQPAEPDGVDVGGILAGMHRYSPAPEGDGPKAQILASGIAMPWAMEAQRLLQPIGACRPTCGR